MFFSETHVFVSGGRSNYRIPSLVVTKNGTVFAFCNDRLDTLKDHADETLLVYARKRPGEAWSEVRTLSELEGWSCGIGSAVYDDAIDRVMVFSGRNPVARNEFGKYTAEELAEMDRRAEEAKRIALQRGIKAGPCIFMTDDGGETWRETPLNLKKTPQTHTDGTVVQIGGSTHGGAHGIRLRHGEHAGRLLCPSRVTVGKYSDWEKIRECVYNNAIYSDDHGETWTASNCVQIGTGEGTLIERGDGSILYNSRAYFRDGKRYLAVSHDGGATYGEFSTDPFLREETRIGCNASFLRVELQDIRDRSCLPEGAEDVTVFVNPRAETRRRMTACVSFDSGATYREARVIYDGPSAYSSLDYDPVSGHFFLLYEKGDPSEETNPRQSPYTLGLAVAEFDMEWLLMGE